MNSVATQNFFKPGGDSGNHTHEFYNLPNKGLMEEWAPLHPLTTHKTNGEKLTCPLNETELGFENRHIPIGDVPSQKGKDPVRKILPTFSARASDSWNL